MTLRNGILTQVAHLRRMRESGKLSAYQVTFTESKCIWRHKDRSVNVLPLDGSYLRTINPSWFEGDQLNMTI